MGPDGGRGRVDVGLQVKQGYDKIDGGLGLQVRQGGTGLVEINT